MSNAEQPDTTEPGLANDERELASRKQELANEPHELFAALAGELRRIAGKISGGQNGQTLQPTALVNEAYLKLCGGRPHSWNDEAHFMRAAARVMRNILIDHKRERTRQKRGGGVAHESLDDVLHLLESRSGGNIIHIHEALEQLAELDPISAELVTLRFFGGRTVQEASQILGIALRTGEKRWEQAKAWLHGRLRT